MASLYCGSAGNRSVWLLPLSLCSTIIGTLNPTVRKRDDQVIITLLNPSNLECSVNPTISAPDVNRRLVPSLEEKLRGDGH
jgi:hypothetical protein